jgi:hypothetical protein
MKLLAILALLISQSETIDSICRYQGKWQIETPTWSITLAPKQVGTITNIMVNPWNTVTNWWGPYINGSITYTPNTNGFGNPNLTVPAPYYSY